MSHLRSQFSFHVVMAVVGVCAVERVAWCAEPAAIPHAAALDRAAVRVATLDDRLDDALILGNGDVNGLLWTEGGAALLTVTKNDVWDARLDSKLSPPLPTLARIKELAAGNWPQRKYVLPEESDWKGPDSYHAHPYPCPRACARIRIGGPTAAAWTPIRAGGVLNAWTRSGSARIMRLRGRKGASNGYAYGPLDLSTDDYIKLHVKLSGSPNARYYVDLMGPDNHVIFASKWQESPEETTQRVFELPTGKRIARVILYTWTEDREEAHNRFESVRLEGPRGTYKLDLAAMTAPASAVLDLRRALARVELDAGEKGHSTAFDLRALAGRNGFLITSNRPIPIALEAVGSQGLPEAEKGEDKAVAWIVQKIPGDDDWKGLTFAVALARDPSGSRTAVAVTTSREFEDPRSAAVRLARDTAWALPDALIADHEARWRAFWSRSGIELDDALVEAVWYRSLYFLRCVTRPGAISPGLFAGLLNDTPAWHGDYHSNYNIQQTFWSAYAANQCELAEPYDRLITEYRPRARWLAKRVFGFSGAYYPHVLFAYEPPEPDKCKSPGGRQYIHHVWGFSIGVAGFTVQPLWWRYKYDPDPEYLQKIAYPAVAEVADFYADFVDQCDKVPDSDTVVLAPSVSPEHWGWTPKLERNRDCAFDIAMFRFIFAAAMEGAKVQNQDAERVRRWQRAATHLPAYPLHGEGAERIVVDVAGAPPITYNIPVPATPVFPGDQVTFRSPRAERALFVRTIDGLRHNGNNAPIMLAAARLRLDMPDGYGRLRTVLADRVRPNGTLSFNRLKPHHRFNDFGHYTEMFGAALPISEVLLQSVGDVVRLFPGLPAGQPAAFTKLRAQGGFLITARHDGASVTALQVESTRGGTLRLVAPWPNVYVESRGAARAPARTDDEGILRIDTKPGQTLVLGPSPPKKS